jgi:hypothetical protein
MRKTAAALLLLTFGSSQALAHHGWGSYDASKRFTIKSTVHTLQWQNPHVMVMVEHEGAMWHLTLAPVSRMQLRGVKQEMLKPGAVVAAEGYPSKRNPNEMRAERITVDGKTFAMR